ncbi:ABC transporter permease [Rhodobacteraceae bacterium F11138]|nr:ABC transporter permease [Rhodobacteraceae bacterium F11138]
MTDMTQDLTFAARSQWWDVWEQFKTHRGALFGMIVFATILAVCFIGPLIWPVDASTVNIGARNQGMSLAHPFGTDQLGRDLFARLMMGGRISLVVGSAAMILSIVIGTAVGMISGFFRLVDGVLMRLTDLFLALPLLPLLLVLSMLFRDPLSAVFGVELGTLLLIVAAISLTSWMGTARVVRSDVLTLKEREFVLAARSIGVPTWRIMPRHILPNVLSSIMVSATLMMATAIMTESALSFLGLGFPPEFATWGRLVSDGIDYLQDYPGRAILPGFLISLTVLSINYIGDGLRDALDPRIRGH